jgi:hypothetical protein
MLNHRENACSCCITDWRQFRLEEAAVAERLHPCDGGGGDDDDDDGEEGVDDGAVQIQRVQQRSTRSAIWWVVSFILLSLKNARGARGWGANVGSFDFHLFSRPLRHSGSPNLRFSQNVFGYDFYPGIMENIF